MWMQRISCSGRCDTFIADWGLMLKRKHEQLREEILVKPSETLADRILLLGKDLTDFADKLDPADDVSEVFGEQPGTKSLHIIVQAPSGGQHNACFPLSFFLSDFGHNLYF